MRLKFILFYCLFAIATCRLILPDKFDPENRKSTDPELTEAVQKVIDTWATHDVAIISQNDSLDHEVGRVTNTIAKIVLPSYPTYRFQTTILPNLHINEVMTITSRSLIFFVYRPQQLPIADVNVILKCFFFVIHPKDVPKVLLMLVVDKEGVNMTLQLSVLFQEGFSSTIALEVSAKGDGTLIPTYIHRYNGIFKNYTRLVYNKDVSDWYTDQYQVLGGSTMKLCYQTRPDNSTRELLHPQFDVIREKMNVTLELVPHLIQHHCDMMYQTMILFNIGSYINNDHTVPVYTDDFCLFIPNTMQRRSVRMSWGLSIAFLVGIAIVVLILGFSTLAGIGTFNRLFNVVAVMLGVWLDALRLSSLTQKILYLCLVQVATRYTSMLYTELFSETAVGQRELKINDFEDLYGLDLKIQTSEMFYILFRDYTDGLVPPKVLAMFEVMSSNSISNTTEDKLGYFSMPLLEAYDQRMLIRTKKKKKKSKKSNLCFGSVSLVQMLPLRQCYKERINDLLLTITQCGFRNYAYSKWNYNGIGGQTVDMEQQVDDSPSVQKTMVMTLLYGYLLVVVVFIGELLVGWFRSRKVVNLVSKT